MAIFNQALDRKDVENCPTCACPKSMEHTQVIWLYEELTQIAGNEEVDAIQRAIADSLLDDLRAIWLEAVASLVAYRVSQVVGPKVSR